MNTAKQNQKFPFHFLSAPPTPPAEENKKSKENFWFLLPRPKGADEARMVRFTTQSERTRQFQATTRSARAKWVRAKVNTSPQKETSESERWEEARAEGTGVGKRARRFATNSDGTGAEKWADLSLVSYLKAI